ncbi:hypothetical protein [Streptomyces lasiicapitis]|uniref:hypothetical protein n=1 Tax=Streptomyces lasiicapitis TaxID=1923961 RepID=UPI003694B1E4
MPEPRLIARRRDDTAADVGTLVQLGVVDEPPTPAPPAEPPQPDPEEQEVLAAAVAEAGVEDAEAVDVLAGLTPEQTAAVARLLNGKNT